ncbi:MAG: hypothetical protein IJ697_01075 [Synergistaceae bacterium]|nr:hypothetical protein [Synergistaceae bacterium]
MTSADNSVDMVRLELLLREHFARTDKQLADMRAENAEFRTLMLKEFNAFTEKIDTRISAFEKKVETRIDAFEKKVDAKFDAVDARFDAFEKKVDEKFNAVDARFTALEKRTDSRFDSVQVQINSMQNDITGLKHDVANLFTWNYWTLSIILALIAMPHIVAGIKSLISGVSELVSAVAGLFRKENKT